jgi:hypothetical protein
MRYVHAQRRAWLTWFVDPEHTDTGVLRAVLRSVPEPAWTVLTAELRTLLTGAAPRAAQEAAARTGGNAVVAPLPDIEPKLALLWAETARRLRAASVFLPSSRRPRASRGG